MRPARNSSDPVEGKLLTNYARLLLPLMAFISRKFQRIPRAVLLFLLIAGAIPFPAFSSGAQTDILLETMQQELKRAVASLAMTDPAPYFLSYTATDIDGYVVVATNGSLLMSTTLDRRQADVIMRVGSAALDNTHGQSRT